MASLTGGLPGVSAFLLSLLQDLDVVVKIGVIDYQPAPILTSTKLKEMENLLRGVEYVVLDAERRRQLGDQGAERWMDDLKDLLYDIDDLLDEMKMEYLQLQQEITGQPSNGNSKVRYDFSQGYLTRGNIKNKLEQLLCILRERTIEADRLQLKRDVIQHNDIWLASQAKVRTKTGCFADEYMIHGREKDKSKIIQMLLAEDGEKSKRNYEFVCLFGMGGLGKTTLAQLVFQDESVKGCFAVRSWACVSDVFDVVKVTQDLVESAAENAKKNDWAANMPTGLPALQARLKNIISDQKFLLVLDDVWTANVFKELIGPLNFGAKGSKILVTTRLQKVTEDLGKKESFHIGRLKNAQCLKIFKDNAFAEGDGIDNDEDLMKMGEEIVRKCKGVPLVAKVIGSLLNGEDEEKWKAVKDNDLWDLAYRDEDLHPALRLSYFYLPPFLKRCFEYFALFPSDFVFDQGEVVRLWMAEGFIEVKEGTELEETGDRYYNDLKRRSLIEENNMMHDMVHHLACIVSGNSFFRGSRGSSSSTTSVQRVRHAFIRDKPDVLFDANKLRTLVHEGDSCQELLSYKCLRVLVAYRSKCGLSYLQCDLKHLRYLKFTYNSGNHTLSDSICKLTNLLGLDLSYCGDLTNLPEDIGNLSNLRFLELCGTAITGLPDSVCSLSNLRFLDLSTCKSLKTLPKDVGNLQSLHELRIYGTSIASFPESVVNATNLRVLTIDDHLTLPAHIGNLSKLENLGGIYRVGKEKGRGIDQLKGMNRLKGRLSIRNMENIECAEDALMANLRSKKHINELWFSWNDFDAALTGRDAEMEVKVLEALEPNAAIKSLSLENYLGHKLPSWMLTSPLHNLTKLHLKNLFWLREATGMELRSLQALELENCPSLREVSMRSAKLKTLEILECKELKPTSLFFPLLWDDLEGLMCDYYFLDHLLQLLKSSNASACTKLKWLGVSVGGDKGITSLPEGWLSILTSVEYLILVDLPPTNFKMISEEDETSYGVPSLVSISTLYVHNCPVLVSLESLELPPRLEQFDISECPNLRSLPYGLSEITSLKRFAISGCPLLETRPHDPVPFDNILDGCNIS